MKIGLIGIGAIASYVRIALEKGEHAIGAILLRPERVAGNRALQVGSVQDLPDDLDVMIDCAGHSALSAYGPEILSRGIDLITVSLGALAHPRCITPLKRGATGQIQVAPGKRCRRSAFRRGMSVGNFTGDA